VAARLADDALLGRGMPHELRADRATQARLWLSTLVIPAGVRDAVLRLIEASAADAVALASAAHQVITVTAPHVDHAARLELERLAAALEAQVLVG
jgi:hypothetical protein